MRVGLQGEKLTWLSAREDGWSVTIADYAKGRGVPETSFGQMSLVRERSVRLRNQLTMKNLTDEIGGQRNPEESTTAE